ncbi:Uncharacterised protein [uncultured archaeon]|nr:Uncharacterised protein [uncultured archaeon]
MGNLLCRKNMSSAMAMRTMATTRSWVIFADISDLMEIFSGIFPVTAMVVSAGNSELSTVLSVSVTISSIIESCRCSGTATSRTACFLSGMMA